MKQSKKNTKNTKKKKKSKKKPLDKRPIFTDMDDSKIKEYLQAYIKDKFTPNSRFMIKVPEHSKEDAVSELYIDLWSMRHQYNPELADYTTWAYNRGRHVIKNIITKHYKIANIRKRVNSVRKIPNTPTPSGYDVAEAKDGIKYALEKMSDEEKDVVKMRFYEDKTIKDIAKCKNCSPQKIYQMISKLKRLAPT